MRENFEKKNKEFCLPNTNTKVFEVSPAPEPSDIIWAN